VARETEKLDSQGGTRRVGGLTISRALGLAELRLRCRMCSVITQAATQTAV
jgi:hypothetical protein